MKQSGRVLGSISGLYWLVTQIGLKKGKKPPKWDIAHISSKMSLLMVRMAWYDKNILVYEISILKMTIFCIQNCLWQETPIFDLQASNSSRDNAAAKMLDFISLEGTHMTQFVGNYQKWPTLLLEKCEKNHFLDFLRFRDSHFHENINLLTQYGYKYWFFVLKIPFQPF